MGTDIVKNLSLLPTKCHHCSKWQSLYSIVFNFVTLIYSFMFVCAHTPMCAWQSQFCFYDVVSRERNSGSQCFYPLSNLKSCISKCFLEYDGQIRKLSVIKYEKIHEFWKNFACCLFFGIKKLRKHMNMRKL